MSSSFSLFILSLLSLISLFFADAEIKSNRNLSDFRFAKKQAHKFYRDLGLSPKLHANIVKRDPLVNASKIVEKRFRFPSISDHDYETARSAAGPNVQEFGHYAGYYSLNNTKGPARMFYYFFESRSADTNAPVVVWLTGGPGCSSSLALFYENGPFHLTNKLSLVWNEFGWDKESNIIFIDQPTGTGFSYSTSEDDIRNTSEEAGVDFYNFILAFFKKHPKYVKNEFYITGESYAGHYIPAFAAQIQMGNKNVKHCQNLYINLKGVAIGNGMTNSAVQYKAYPDYALEMNLINQSHYHLLQEPVQACLQDVRTACNAISYNWTACSDAKDVCDDIFFDIMDSNKGINYYDIRKRCKGSICYDFSRVERFLNRSSVKKALGVDESIPFVSCGDEVYYAMYGDWMRNLAVYVPELLQDDIKVLIYAGDHDLICNVRGNLDWVISVEWKGSQDFLGTPFSPFKVDDVMVGSYKTSGPLTFLNISNAGHMVPMDQPKTALEMLRRWIKGEPL